MKNTIKIFGTQIRMICAIALAAIIGFSFASCGSGAGSSQPPADPELAVYESQDSEGNIYILEITSAGRAVYTPKTGDNYTLTIKNKSGAVIGKSNGTVTVTVNGSTNSFTLAPSNSPTETFTITIVNTETGGVLMTAIIGPITLADGRSIEAPRVNPVRTYEKFELYANKWWEFNNSWSNDIRLSDFTTERPVKGKIYVFSLSGTTDKLLNNVKLELSTWVAEESDWRWVGGAEIVPIPTLTFVDQIFKVYIYNDPIPNVPINLGIENVLWNEANGVDSGERLPPGTNNGDLMATIRNFKISLIGVEDDEGDSGYIPDNIVGNIYYYENMTNIADAKSQTDFSFISEWYNGTRSYYPLSKYIDGQASVKITDGDVIFNVGTPKPEYINTYWVNNMSPVFEIQAGSLFYTSDGKYQLMLSYWYTYSGDDQTITGIKYFDFDDGRHTTVYNVSLKKGWNWVLWSYNEETKTTTPTASVSITGSSPYGSYYYVSENN